MNVIRTGTISSEYIEVDNGVRLHIRDWGQGAPILLIHGWASSNDIFDYQMLALAEAGLRPLSLSLRGFGKSDKPWRAYDYNIFCDDIRSVMDQLGLENVVLAGFTMGAAIAVRYMTRHEGRRVSKLALFGAAAPSWTKRDDYPYGINRSEVDTLIRAVRSDRPRLFSDFIKMLGLTDASLSAGHAAWIHSIAMQASPYALEQTLIALRDTDLRPELNSIHTPTAIFHAVGDRICPFRFAAELAAEIETSIIIPFENSGHTLFLEEKERFNIELISFAREGINVPQERWAEPKSGIFRGEHETLH
jgi:non-heme chloroperoxidase